MKVTFSKPKITITGNKTIYKLPYRINFSYDEGNRNVRNILIPIIEAIAKVQGFKLQGTAVGIATCHAKDIYDKTIGLRLAESKAKQKAYKRATRIFEELGCYIGWCGTALLESAEKHDLLWDDEIEHFNEITE